MAIQLQLEFDQHNLKKLKSVVQNIDQEELIRELSKILLNIIKVEKKEAVNR